MNRLVFVYLAVFNFTGCQVTTTQLGSDFKAPKVSRKQQTKILADVQCPIKLDEFQDLRKSKSLGSVALTIVENDVAAWVKSAMSHYNIKESNEVNVSRIQVGLVKAYIQSMLSSMSANVVFSVRLFNAESGEYGKRLLFRGHEVSTNWNSGDNEISETLNQALSNALLKVKESLREQCNKGTTAV